MSLSVVSHWHLVTNCNKALGALSKLNPHVIRVSSFQYPFSKKYADSVKCLTDNGYTVGAICSSDYFMKLSMSQWESYVKLFAASIKNCNYAQILNECNTARFSGAQPNISVAFKYFKSAVKIIKDKNPSVRIVAPGLTCENKTDNKTKISCSTFLKSWINLEAETLIDYWALHYYDTDERHKRTLQGNIALIRSKSVKPVVITETGSNLKQIIWYKKIKDGLEGLTHGSLFWYCFNGHDGFSIINNDGTPNPVYYEMLKP